MNSKFTCIVFIIFTAVWVAARQSLCNMKIANGGGSGCPPTTIWSYSRRLNECIYEEYEGCKLTNNQFATKEQCLNDCGRSKQSAKSDCSVELRELETFADGNCYHKTVWSYDQDYKHCRNYDLTGCSLHGNKFETHSECEFYCIDRTTTVNWNPLERCDAPFVLPEQHPFVVDRTCRTRHLWKYDKELNKCTTFRTETCDLGHRYFFDLYECNFFCLGAEYQQWLVSKNKSDVCNLPISNQVIGRCNDGTRLFSYDISTNTCYEWVYYGCEITGNKFPTYDDCAEICIISGISDTEETFMDTADLVPQE